MFKELCASKIFLPNVNAATGSSSELYAEFGCNVQQIGLIKAMTAKRDYYYMSEQGNRVFQLALRASEFPFVTATAKKDQQKMNQMLIDNPVMLEDPFREWFITEWYKEYGQEQEAERYRALVAERKKRGLTVQAMNKDPFPVNPKTAEPEPAQPVISPAVPYVDEPLD